MRQVVVIVLCLAAFVPAFADGPADEAAIRRIIAEAEAAANRGEFPDDFEEGVHSDVMFTNVFGSVYRGRTEYIERHRTLMNMFKGARIKQTVQRIFFVRPDVALVLLESLVTGVKGFPAGTSIAPDGTLRTLGLNVFTKEQGRWVVAAWHNTDVKPPVPGAR